MSVVEVKDWLYIAGAALSLGAIVYAWLTGRSKANAEALRELSDRVLVHNTKIEALLKIQEEISIVHRRMDTVVEATSRLNGTTEQMSRQLGLIHKHLLGEKA